VTRTLRPAFAAAFLAFAAAGASASDDSELLERFRKAFPEKGNPAVPEDRVAAAAAVGAVRGRAGPEAVCRALGPVLERAEAISQELARMREELAALSAELAANGNTTTPEKKARMEKLRTLDEVLRDRGDDERKVAAALREALARFTDLKALDWLAGSGLRGSFAPEVRAAAAEALGASGSADPGVIRSLRGALKDKEALVREAAVKAVARLQPKEEETLRDLAASLEDARWNVRLAAVRRLGDMAIPGAVDLLVARLPKEEGRLARVLGDILGVLTGQRFGTEADGWRRWWEENRAAYASGARTLAPGASTTLPDAGVADGSNYYGIPVESKRILFLIDISGSMNKPGGTDPKMTKVEEAKRELLRCIKSLEGASAFGVFAFCDGVRKWRPGIVKAEAPAKDDAKKWIDALDANQCTNTYAALDEAIRASAADPRNSMGADYGLFADTIFLLTDGSPTTPEGKPVDARGRQETERVLEAVRGWNREKRVAIHCIGVGPEINSAFLATLATENGGTFVTVR
jgi:uncharacterized protein YegL